MYERPSKRELLDLLHAMGTFRRIRRTQRLTLSSSYGDSTKQQCNLLQPLTYSGNMENRSCYIEPEGGIEKEGHVTISVEGVSKNLRKMKHGRSLELGNIPVELLKSGSMKLIERLVKLMNRCCQQDRLPKERKTSFIVPVFKKGDSKDSECYRRLSINSYMSRLFGIILQDKLRTNIKHKILEDQSVFTPRKSCTKNLIYNRSQ
ncbi:hypothetical protein ILUMI_04476 [Ignelater luminosus]|uniref:Reverse transcriptase domain-containing protein n=1 Tax=Ignelater luminosus TaxID=2038154 RepID=A0A8K0D8X8_IGNLU|nr:hypothetical protein ILUMI_04476 [Ignelater luminosus]